MLGLIIAPHCTAPLLSVSVSVSLLSSHLEAYGERATQRFIDVGHAAVVGVARGNPVEKAVLVRVACMVFRFVLCVKDGNTFLLGLLACLNCTGDLRL